MRGLDANDWLPLIAIDGEVAGMREPETHARVAGSEPAFAPIVEAVRKDATGGSTPRGLWVAVSSRFSTASLSGLLGQFRAAGSEVQGFVDAAVAVCAWLQPGRTAVVLDMGARGAVLGVVTREGDDYRLRRSAAAGVGVQDLHEDWVRMLGASMVRQSRFDPLHDAAHERALRSALPALIEDAARTGAAQLVLAVDDRQITLGVSRDQLELAVRDRLRPLGDTLQALCAALGDCELIVPAAVAHWPGVGEVLALAGSRPVGALAPGAVARAASLLPPTAGGQDGGVQYLTQLAPMGRPAPADVLQALDVGMARRAGPPTHLVYRGRALAIGNDGLVLGRDPGEGAGVLQLPEGIAGLSRRHCTLRRVGDEAVLVDHSRYGSFIDGVRVSGRTLLTAGSMLRLGTPGIELPLIAIESQAGA